MKTFIFSIDFQLFYNFENHFVETQSDNRYCRQIKNFHSRPQSPAVEERRVTLSFAGVTVQALVESTELITSAIRAPNAWRQNISPTARHFGRQQLQPPEAPASLDYAVEVQLGRSAPLGRRVDRSLTVGETNQPACFLKEKYIFLCFLIDLRVFPLF